MSITLRVKGSELYQQVRFRAFFSIYLFAIFLQESWRILLGVVLFLTGSIVEFITLGYAHTPIDLGRVFGAETR